MFFNKLIPSLIWALFILLLCALPGSVIPELTFLDWLKPDKLVHLFLFGVLSFLLIKGLAEQTAQKFFYSNPKVLSILISALYGVFIELLQEFIFTSRHGDVYDAIADAIGALIGLWVYDLWQKRKVAGKEA